MKKPTAISGVAVTAVAVSLVVVGCGPNSANKSAPTTTTSSTGKASAAPPTQKTVPPTQTMAGPFPNTAASGPNPTIETYVQENHIQETQVHRGDPGAPNVNLPVPAGWAVAPGSSSDWAYGGAIVYTGPEAAQNALRITALLFKLTGNLDSQKILALTPGELNNLKGYKAITAGAKTKLAGHDAYQAAGYWLDNGQSNVAAIKTVAIPGSDGLYVLQVKAGGPADQLSIVAPATKVIDDQATIT